MREIINQTSKLPSKISKQDLIKLEKEKLKKAVIASEYLIDYVSSGNGELPSELLDSFITAIRVTHIDTIDHLRNMNNIQQIKSH